MRLVLGMCAAMLVACGNTDAASDPPGGTEDGGKPSSQQDGAAPIDGGTTDAGSDADASDGPVCPDPGPSNDACELVSVTCPGHIWGAMYLKCQAGSSPHGLDGQPVDLCERIDANDDAHPEFCCRQAACVRRRAIDCTCSTPKTGFRCAAAASSPPTPPAQCTKSPRSNPEHVVYDACCE